ncbi:MAG TPA: helix-turn-helix domain-containing protein [Xanthobacteraceae bacterium]|nr:helix-turn-helix domain-containing protein [Xanthobacteraceae bacterium]
MPVLRERNCSVARVVGILSDAWTFLIIREAFFGARRFESFRTALGLPRATLTERLKRLTHQGIFRQHRTSQISRRAEYRLTRAGLELYPSFMAMMQFGDRWLPGNKGAPLRMIHDICGCECQPLVACSSCLQEVTAVRVNYRNGSGAGYRQAQPVHRARRSSDASQFSRGRPSSVSRTLEIIGDRWSFLIIREAFLGARRFDRLMAELNIASNILTDRLARLVGTGIFERRKYQSQPDRYEYRLTAMGKDLYGPLIVMLAWGDRWLSRGGPPIILTHRDCGNDFTPTVICNHCKKPIEAHGMRYHMNYDPRDFGAPAVSDRAAAIGGAEPSKARV